MRLKAILACGILLLGSLPIYSQEVIRARRRSAGALTLAPGFTLMQDTGALIGGGPCATATSTCTFGIAPTTSNSGWALFVGTGNTTHITSASGGGGTWTLCPSSECNVSGTGGAADAIYNVTGNSGTTSVTVNLNVNATGYFTAEVWEVLPPAGFSISYNKGGTAATTSCTSCSGVPFTTTATTAILQFNNNGGSTSAWNSWSAPYITTEDADGLYLNAPAGTIAAPTFTQSSGYSLVSAISFKSSAGAFTTAPIFSLKNYVNSRSVTCNPTCSITVPSTGTGRLLFIWVGTIASPVSALSAVANGGTWTVDGTCPIVITATTDSISCAYAPSSSSGVTSISITMTANASISVAYYEVSRSSGSFVLDTHAASQRSATANGLTNGQALTLSGADDVILQGAFIPGTDGFITLYPQTFVPGSGGFGEFLSAGGQAAILLDTANGAAPVWIGNQSNQANSVSAMAFK